MPAKLLTCTHNPKRQRRYPPEKERDYSKNNLPPEPYELLNSVRQQLTVEWHDSEYCSSTASGRKGAKHLVTTFLEDWLVVS